MPYNPDDSPPYQFLSAVIDKLKTLSWMAGHTVETTNYDSKINFDESFYPYIEVELAPFGTRAWTEQTSLDGQIAVIVTCFINQKKEATVEGENLNDTNTQTITNYCWEAWKKVVSLMEDRELGIPVADGFTAISGVSDHLIEPMLGPRLMLFSFAISAEMTNLTCEP